jgi:glyoxylase-like metal-dependent hydrolase (beta-lactamase superfamily II)
MDVDRDRDGMSELGLRFLGVGGSSGMDNGSASAVLEDAGGPVLMIDCGQDSPHRYQQAYGGVPPALFLTHTHMDHISGLEPLFYAAWFGGAQRQAIRVFAPAPIIPALQQRLVSERSPLAEGGVNLWDAFQLVPVTRGFWWRQLWFDVFPVRHHRPDFAFGIRLAGRFLYTGDTRPIPEVLAALATAGETVFHDCRPDGNPSHAGWADLQRDYPPGLLERVIAYHFGTRQDGIRLRTLGARVAEPGERYGLGGDPRPGECQPAEPPGGSTVRVA